MNTTLLPFHQQLANAWKLFLHRWGSALIIQLFMIIPGILMYPLVVQYLQALQEGIDPAVVYQNSVYGVSFVWGFVLLLLVGVITSTALIILFAAQEKIFFITAIISALRRFVPVLYTSLLSAIAVVVALLPAFGLNYWYASMLRSGVAIDGSGIVALDAVVLVAVIALLIPAALVVVWSMYAPLLVALKASPTGFTAIMQSKHLVHGHLWQIVWRVLGTIVLFRIIGASVQSLNVASLLVPYVLAIVAIAYFVELYKELNEGGA